jgi:hypothetical protein
MFLRILVAVVCVLCLLWALGSKQQQARSQQSSGAVTSVKTDGHKETIKKIQSARDSVAERLATIKVPNVMVKYGKPQRLSREQKRNYAILASFFKNDPVMVKVAACESSFWHTLPDGKLHVSGDGKDVGQYQLRLPVHGDELSRYGLNPADFAHNVAFATHLYRRDGLRHWNSSRSCWETLQFLV